jgi:hypothetical protein
MNPSKFNFSRLQKDFSTSKLSKTGMNTHIEERST